MKHLSIIIILICVGCCFCGFLLGWAYGLSENLGELTIEQRQALPYLIEKLEYARNDHLWYAENPDRWYSHHRTVEWEYMWVDVYDQVIPILEEIK